jgi:hypothetical protein
MKGHPKKSQSCWGVRVLQAAAAADNAHWATAFCQASSALTVPYQRLISP